MGCFEKDDRWGLGFTIAHRLKIGGFKMIDGVLMGFNCEILNERCMSTFLKLDLHFILFFTLATKNAPEQVF